MPFRNLCDMEPKVGPAHRHAETHRFPKSELGDDVIGHAGGGGGGQGDPAGIGVPGPKDRQVEVILAEGVAPLTDAVGFVHGNGSDGHGPASRLEGRLLEPLGCNEEKPARAVLEAGQGTLDFLGMKARCDGHRSNAGLFEALDLVGHQGD